MFLKDRYYYACEKCGEVISKTLDYGVTTRFNCEQASRYEQYSAIPNDGIVIVSNYYNIKTKDNKIINNLSKFNLIIEYISASFDYSEGIKLLKEDDDNIDIFYKLSKHKKKQIKIIKTYELVVDLNAKAKKDKIYLIEDNVRLKGYKTKLKEILDPIELNNFSNIVDESIYSIILNLHYRNNSNTKTLLSLIENPVLEILAKSGFSINIFGNYSKSIIREEINAEGKNLEEIFGLTKSKIKYLKKIYENDATKSHFWNLLKLFQINKDLDVSTLVEFFEKLSEANLKYKTILGLNNTYFYPYDRITILLTYIKKYNIDKKTILKYLCETMPEKQGLYDIDININRYIGYLKSCENLEIKNFEKYPKSLSLEIERLKYLELLNRQEIMDKKFKNRYNENVLFDYSSEKDGYKIESPSDINQIKTFANELGNCVASYINRYCDGISKIYFLKDLNNKNKVIGCIELNKNNYLVQALGKCNIKLSGTENNFVTAWKKHIKQIENTKVVA